MMRWPGAISLILWLICAQTASAATYTSPDSSVVVTASTIELSQGRVSAAGKARIVAVDRATGTRLEADAAKIQVVFASGAATRPGLGSVQSAEMTGPVSLVYVSQKTGEPPVRVTASAESASYDGATGIARLAGGVKITSDDPVRFAAPAVMTADTALVNLAPEPGPDDFRFRLESSPGVSRIEVTPKPQEKPAR